ARRRTGRRAATADGIGRRDVGEGRIVQGVITVVPVVAAEGPTRQTHLHDVVELAVTGIDLDLAVVQHVVGAANARSDFVAPAELYGGKALRIVGGLALLVEADAEVESQAVAHRPVVLEVQGMRILLIRAGVYDTGADNEVPVAALAQVFPRAKRRQIL